MKKILAAVILIAAIGGYAVWNSSKPSTVTALTTTTNTGTPNTTSAGSETTNPAAIGGTDTTGTTNTTGSTATTGTYKDGTYTGSIADAFYGKLQVAAVISGGKITDVKFLQYPKDQHESQEVNNRSNPILKSEAIAAQSAKVNIVSGATQSSEAFQQSLASALTKAQS
jgi:uncharacterized protein with FMN-binding domain